MPSIIPLPTFPGISPNFGMTIRLSNSANVPAGTVYYTNSLELMYQGDDYHWAVFTNDGILWNRCLNNYVGTIISSQNFAYLINNGLMVSEAPTGQAITLQFYSYFGGLTNTGQIYALSSKWGAFAFVDWGYSDIYNAGLIAAQRTPAVPDGPNDVVYGALAITRHNGGRVINAASGAILAEGPWAQAVWLDRGHITSPGSPERPDIDNAGLIEAVATVAGEREIGVKINSLDMERIGIVNSGTIRAEVAILLVAEFDATGALPARKIVSNLDGGVIDGAIVASRYDEIIVNHGLISGAVGMDEGDDLIVNAGRMSGAIDLGAGNDLYLGLAALAAANVRGGAGIDLLIGGAAADSIDGGDGNDWLQGGGGADILTGGAGADRFVIAAAGESSAAAADTIKGFETGIDKIDLSAVSPSSVALSAAGGVTTLTAQTAGGTIVIQVEGTVAPGDILQGPAGSLLNGTSDAEVLAVTGAVTELHGGGGNDLLVGSTGNDLLDGGTGADIMSGGPGDDIYIVDNSAYGFDANGSADRDTDRVIELDGEGMDEVRTSVQFVLPDGVENLTFTGAGGIRVEGNPLDNVMIGNDAANIMAGLGGNDVLIGGGGADFLEGDLGADRFVYLAPGDSTAAAYDELYGFESGIDMIDLGALHVTSFSWTRLTDNGGIFPQTYYMVSVGTTEGALAIRVDASTLSLSDFIVHPVIAGTVGDDVLHGTDFADKIDGLAGNDTLYGGGGGDLIDGGAGQNSLYGEDGNDTLIASGSAGDALFGGAGYDLLAGGAGNDRLQGDAGGDRLAGGGGGDIFVFTSTVDSLDYAMRSDGKKQLPDVIADFTSGLDKIDLSAIDAVASTPTNDAFTFIGTNAFSHHAGELRFEVHGGTAQIYADVDGDGLADFQIAAVTPTLQAGDFIL